MPSAFTLADAAIAKDQIFPASITKIELRENGGTSDQWQSFGDLDDGVLDVQPSAQPISGRRERQFGYAINFTGNLVCSGDAMRAALINVLKYPVDIRLTDINGHAYTLASEASGLLFDLKQGEIISASNDVSQARKFPLTGSGFATGAKWDALFATT